MFALDTASPEDIALVTPQLREELIRAGSGTTGVVDRFAGAHRFLAPNSLAPMLYDGVLYPTLTHAYQASKAPGIRERRAIARLPFPADAVRRCGTHGDLVAALPTDWRDSRPRTMADIVHAKYTQRVGLADALLSTGDMLLAHSGVADRYWAAGSDGSGDNRFGRIHMYERARLRAAAMRRAIPADMQSAIVFPIFIGADGNAHAEPGVLSRKDNATYVLETLGHALLVAPIPANPLEEIGFGASPWEGVGAVLPPEERLLNDGLVDSAEATSRCDAVLSWFVITSELPVTCSEFKVLLRRAAILGEVRLTALTRQGRATAALKAAIAAALHTDYPLSTETVDGLAEKFAHIAWNYA